MCGRYVAATDAEGLTRFLIVDEQRGGDLPPSWNVAPTSQVPAVVAHDGRRVLTDLRWGLVPFWAKDLAVGARMINARSETVHETRAFAESVEQRRCLIPADGFYEWQRVPDGTKRGARLPWFVHRTDGDPMVFAGIWSSWRDRAAGPDAPRVRTCAILTTGANGVLEDIHDRMPVILEGDGVAAWLDPQSDLVDLRGLLVPAADDVIARHRVSTRVNTVSEDDPDLLRPLSEDDRDDVSGTLGTPGQAGGTSAAGVAQPSLFDE